MREWRVTEPLPPRFQEGVWRKIQQADSSAAPATTTTLWALLMARMAAVLPRPAVAVAYMAVLFAVGTASGYWQARTQTSRSHEQMGTRYVQAVDPYQKPRL